MLENVNLSTEKSSTERRNNRKRTKVFDPCISNKKKKMDEKVGGNENVDSPVDQISIIKKHLLTISNKDLNKTMDDMCSELGLHRIESEDDLSDDSEYNSEVPKTHTSVELCIKKMFEGLDDYAPFNHNLVGSTPKLERNQVLPYNSSTPSSPFMCRPKSILKSNSVRSLVSITPLSNRTNNVQMSSLASSCNETTRRPLGDKTNTTPETSRDYLNGFLTSPRRVAPAALTSVQDTYSTPRRSSRNINKKSLSPIVVEVSPEVKKTLLLGVACYVDVKTNKEDCSSAVASELISMGATAEKTFNKKVTHVVFKEGKPSTYLKAKKLGVPMVSVLWIEACKKKRTLVDPALYPPINAEKYETLSPEGRRIPTLKTIQRNFRKYLLREAGYSADSKTNVRINWRKALTDIKLPPPSSQSSRHCTKKLDFNRRAEVTTVSRKSIMTISDSPGGQPIIDSIRNVSGQLVVTQTQSQIVYNQSTGNNGGLELIGGLSMQITNESCGDHEAQARDNGGTDATGLSELEASPPSVRRNSAPAQMISTRKKCKRKPGPTVIPASQKCFTIDQHFARQTQLNLNTQAEPFCNKENIDLTQNSQTTSRKRKLFNPEEAIVIIDTPDEKSTPPPAKYEFPYKDDDFSSRKRLRTKSTSMKKVFKKMVVKKQTVKKSLAALLEQNESSICDRSSLSYFAGLKPVPPPRTPKEPPTIVCTSLLPEQVRKIAYIVGKLGVFDLEDKVSSRTTHLVTAAPRRTINLLKALVRGAWILNVDWVYQSEKADHWLNEEEYELKTFSHAVTEMRRERQAVGPDFSSELFATCGSIYVSKKSVPPCEDMTELIRLSKGRIVNSASSADLIIGGKCVEGETGVRLKEKWVLDSITQNTLLDQTRYVIKANQS